MKKSIKKSALENFFLGLSVVLHVEGFSFLVIAANLGLIMLFSHTAYFFEIGLEQRFLIFGSIMLFLGFVITIVLLRDDAPATK